LFEQNRHFTYSVAWVDSLAKGKSIGKSILLLGEHADEEDLSSQQLKNKLKKHAEPKFNVPFTFPSFVLNNFTMKLFNILFYNKQFKKENINELPNGILYLKGGDLTEDLKSFPNATEYNIADFFKLTYAENLFIQAGADYIFEYNSLEADDCIALTTKYLLQKYKNNIEIYIITSDQDYLQLACNEVKLYNLKYKLLTDSKNCKNDPQKDLFFKIVGGDKSDDISAIFKKCGPKTIEKCYDDKDFFHNKFEKEKEDGSLEKYELNKLLVDFNNIPKHLCQGFMHDILSNKI
jgi:5'-3' exonuclease